MAQSQHMIVWSSASPACSADIRIDEVHIQHATLQEPDSLAVPGVQPIPCGYAESHQAGKHLDSLCDRRSMRRIMTV